MRVNSQNGEEFRIFACGLPVERLVLAAMLLSLCTLSPRLEAQSEPGQTTTQQTTEQKVEQLAAAVAQAQSQIEAYQNQLIELRQQLAALKQQMVTEKASSLPTAAPPSVIGAAVTSSEAPATLDELRERQALEESQIATHDLTKVETESKYPLKVSGLLLLNGFVNTRQVDVSASPAYAIRGPGSTGLSVRQTVLGLDARGPRLFAASSHADLRVYFFASGTLSNYAASGILRLRTAHAALDWRNTEAFFALDRSILEPDQPSSLVALAQSELAWAGNLWTWNPQVGITRRISLTDSSRINAQAALIDTSDPLPPGSTSSAPTVTQTERSRWPGTEARIAFQHGESGNGPEFGVGGYFSPHRDEDGDTFDAWAGTMDLRLPLSRHFEMKANAYRGQALAGLGGGGYINYFYSYRGLNWTVRALDDVGGWAQLKARAARRVEINAGYGADNPFAKEIRAALSSSADATYAGLARNRSFFSNAIYSPSTYLIFSLEYKRLWTNFNNGTATLSDVIGIGAGYRF